MASKKPRFQLSEADISIIEIALEDRVSYLEDLLRDPATEHDERPLCQIDLLATQDLLKRLRLQNNHHD